MPINIAERARKGLDRRQREPAICPAPPAPPGGSPLTQIIALGGDRVNE
jgi:hypothetical protein